MKDYSKQNNERIVKNTLTLYVRTALVMLVSLFTSRVVLSALGIEDYGIYNIVGGVVVMFSVVSGHYPLQSAVLLLSNWGVLI